VARKTAKALFKNESHGICRRAPYGDQLVILEFLRERIITLEHHATVSAHPGINRMYYAMRRRYYWPSMVLDIYNTITKCTTCAQNPLSLRRHTSPLTLFPGTEPLTDRLVDIFGPIPTTKAGNRFILVLTDRFSNLTKCVTLRRIIALSVTSANIDAWVACYGAPDRIPSDQGPQFMSNFFIAVMKALGNDTVHPTAYHPQTNGKVERYNHTMATQLRHYVTDDPRSWDELLPVLTMAYNSKPQRSTGIAPFDLVIPRRIPSLSVRNLPPGTPLKNNGTLNDGSPLARKREFMAKLRQKIPAVVKALQKTQQRYLRNLHSNLDTRNKRVRVGDFVYTNNHQQKNKLQSRTVGDCPPSLQDDDTPPAPFTQGVGSEPNGLLFPSVHDLTTTVEDLMYQSTEATHIAPRWEGAPWDSDAKAACASHDVLPHASNHHNGTTTWALVAFQFNKETSSATHDKPSLSK